MFSLPLKCSEGNSERSLLFLFNGTEFRVIFSSAEGFGTEFRGFLFRGTAGIPSEITICSVYSVFRGIFFLSEIPNPTYDAGSFGASIGNARYKTSIAMVPDQYPTYPSSPPSFFLITDYHNQRKGGMVFYQVFLLSPLPCTVETVRS